MTPARSRRRRPPGRRLPVGSIVTLACLLALGGWGWRYVDERFIGDADGRIHLYNSGGSWPVSLEIRRLDADEPPRVVVLAAGDGYTHRVIHAGAYVVDVVSPEHLARSGRPVEMPPREDDVVDVLLDVGGRGEFRLVPVFYLPVGSSEKEGRAVLARLESEYPEYVIGPARRQRLPVRVDYGLHERAPAVQGGSMPSRPGWRRLPRRLAGGLLEDALGYEEREAYYVLTDRAGYGRVARTGKAW